MKINWKSILIYCYICAIQDIMCQLKTHLNTLKMGQQGQRVPTGILGQGTPKRQRPTHQVNKITFPDVKNVYISFVNSKVF